jgi:hypothetical protein
VCERYFLFNQEWSFAILLQSVNHEKNVVEVCMNGIPDQRCCVKNNIQMSGSFWITCSVMDRNEVKSLALSLMRHGLC